MVEALDSSRLSGRPPGVLEMMRTLSLVPFSAVALLVVAIAIMEIVRSLRDSDGLATTARGLVEGNYHPYEAAALTAFIGVTVFFGIFFLPTGEIFAESASARVPEVMSLFSSFLQLWFVPIATVLLVLRVVAWRTEKNIIFVRVVIRVLALVSGLTLWIGAASGL